jgi:hypothetical protein
MFETLAEALHAHIESVQAKGGVFLENPDEMYQFVAPVRYGETMQDHRELARLKGKFTKQWAHASIYRMETGRYELTSYIS